MSDVLGLPDGTGASRTRRNPVGDREDGSVSDTAVTVGGCPVRTEGDPVTG